MLALAMFNNNTAWAELMHVCVIASGESAFNAIYSVAKFYQWEEKKKKKINCIITKVSLSNWSKEFLACLKCEDKRVKPTKDLFFLFLSVLYTQAMHSSVADEYENWKCNYSSSPLVLWICWAEKLNFNRNLLLVVEVFEWSFSYNICNKVEKKSQLNLC